METEIVRQVRAAVEEALRAAFASGPETSQPMMLVLQERIRRLEGRLEDLERKVRETTGPAVEPVPASPAPLVAPPVVAMPLPSPSPAPAPPPTPLKHALERLAQQTGLGPDGRPGPETGRSRKPGW